MGKYCFPQFFRFIRPNVEVLKELDGSGRTSKVADAVIEKMELSEEELFETIKSGISRVKNQTLYFYDEVSR